MSQAELINEKLVFEKQANYWFNSQQSVKIEVNYANKDKPLR